MRKVIAKYFKSQFHDSIYVHIPSKYYRNPYLVRKIIDELEDLYYDIGLRIIIVDNYDKNFKEDKITIDVN